jgi:hypothetical protein
MFHTLLLLLLLFSEIRTVYENVGKYGTARQAADDNIIRRMRFACWITKATDTPNMQCLLLYHGNNAYANAPQCYVIRTLPVLLGFTTAVRLSNLEDVKDTFLQWG